MARAVVFPLLLLNGAAAEPWVRAQPTPDSFALVSETGPAPAAIVYSATDAKVVALAATDLAADIERVTGRKPALRADAATASPAAPSVLIGTLGRNPLIDQLVARGQLDVGDLAGKWESFVIAVVRDPFPNVPHALVIAGSDRRGTAFGVYELSQAIGVSPWHWWADVAPAKQRELHVAAGTRRFGPPSVKYRGIFINDEDWGLQPWAAKTFEPEVGDIGPKTYAKIFELMLRLKANTVWPAMHACTKPFNHYPANKQVADDYAIVMGSSHAEPMLRNNVGEWPHDRPTDYNYVTNREGVRTYWEERVRENGRFENIYTLGMRGIHDSGIQGARTDPERIRILEQAFADQRAMLAQHVRPEVTQVPQMFCAYKEVLGLYRQGLKVPDDVTIVWPDDNFGYVRNFASAEEQKRRGGFGVYYHLSYLGAPMAYLWLYTTPPALVWEEMTKAYDHGARTIWIANVGDLKPAEIGTEFFLQLAWDIHAWPREKLPDFLAAWAAREFGAEDSRAIAEMMRRYYALNFQRKPEHLQWWLPRGEQPRPSALTRAEIEQRRAAFAALRAQAEAMLAALPAAKRDAFFELVAYPITGSALFNERTFCGELAALTGDDAAAAEKLAAQAVAADAELKEQTRRYNEETAGGKWRGLMRVEPADDQWRSFRMPAWQLPKFAAAPAPRPEPTAPDGAIALEAEQFARVASDRGAAWGVIPGLGRTGDSVAVFPTTALRLEPAAIGAHAPRLEHEIRFERAGDLPVTFYLIPTQPIAGSALRFAIALDEAAPQPVALEVKDGSAEWAQGVLNATRTVTTTLRVPTAGAHTLRIYGPEAGVVLDKIVIDLGGLRPSYLGPPAVSPP